MKEAFRKKGSLLVPISIFFAIFMLISLIALSLIKSGSFEKSLGDRQLDLFTVYQRGEKYLYLVDASARLAIQPALLKISRTGLKQSPDCGSFVASQSYNLWSRQYMNGACFPATESCPPATENIKKYFTNSFKPGFNLFMDTFNGAASPRIPVEDARLEVEYHGGVLRLARVAAGSIVFESIDPKDRTRLLYRYSIKPSFSESIPQNFLEDATFIADKVSHIPLRLERDEFKSRLSQFTSENSGLKWNLDGNFVNSPQAPCSHEIGICSYECNCQTSCDSCGEDGKSTCCSTSCDTCTGTEIETVSYNNVYAPISVDTGKSFQVYNSDSSKVESVSLLYNFGIGWIEETGRSTECKPV